MIQKKIKATKTVDCFYVIGQLRLQPSYGIRKVKHFTIDCVLRSCEFKGALYLYKTDGMFARYNETLCLFSSLREAINTFKKYYPKQKYYVFHE